MRQGWLAAALLAWGSLSAAPTDPWLRLNTAHFELFTSAGERGGRDAIVHFERVRSFFQQAFGILPHGGNPVQIVIFRSAKDYDPYRFNQVSNAYFETGLDHDFIVMQTGAAEAYQVAVHEYTHLLIHQMGRIPRWLNEGLAELYSNLEPRGDEVLVGRLIAGRVAMLASQRWLPLGEVIAVDEHSPLYNETTHAGMFYAESWFLVHMLALQEFYSPRFRDLGQALQTMDTAQAFQKVYGKTVDQVQQDLQLYARSSQLTGRLFHIRMDEKVEAPTVERGGFRARAALAEILNSLPEHRDAAHRACEELERDFGDRWETRQHCAEVFWRDRNLVDASLEFARAVDLAPDEAQLRVEYGRVLSAQGRAAAAIPQFRKAVEIDGAWDDARYELAVALVQTTSYQEALSEFGRVKKLPPEQAVRYYYNLAVAHFKLGDTDGAKKLIDKAAPFVKTDRDRRAMDELRTACCGN